MIDTNELQGGMLRGYNHPVARYLFARVRAPAAARALLARLADEVTPERDWAGPKPAVTCNVALSHRALCALELPQALLDGFPAEVRAGMAARAELLGDDPAGFDDELRDLEVVLMLQGESADELRQAAERHRGALDAGGLEVTAEQCAGVLARRREHFGFTDGFSQPAIAGFAREDVPGQGVPYRRWRLGRLRWRPLAAGEFVLGHPDEDGDPPPAPPAPFDRDTSYLVLRKLRQDVATFRAQVAAEAARLGLGEEEFAARLVGRWPDGSPLALRPDRPDKRLGRDPAAANHFAYGDDPDGERCPRGAHVRRTNPRDALGWEGRLTARHRILRRGMPYGKALAPGALDDRADRGLMFVSVQASIARQFEIVQQQWCNDGNAFGLGHEPDPIAGSAGCPARPIVGTGPPVIAGPLQGCVRCLGGEYLVAPSRRALRALPGL
ncbi:MAG: Dyp-type peroxidase [Solirubrobacteraceae bacterium]